MDRPSPVVAAPPVTVEVATLLGSRGLDDSICCLQSLQRCSALPLRFRIHEDGTLTPEHLARLHAELDISRVVSRRDADAEAVRRLADYPASRKLRDENVLALKLFDIVWFEESNQVRYVDSDVLFLRPFSGPPAAADPHRAVFFPDRQSAYSLRFWELAGRPAFRFPQRINTGLFTIAKDALDFDLVERFLAGWRGFAPVWIEQTCWALVAGSQRAAGGCALLDDGQFRIHRPELEMGPDLVALHFVSPVRDDFARVAGQATRTDAAPVTVRTTPSKRLRASRLLLESTIRKAGL